jgi:hypothetical protein
MIAQLQLLSKSIRHKPARIQHADSRNRRPTTKREMCTRIRRAVGSSVKTHAADLVERTVAEWTWIQQRGSSSQESEIALVRTRLSTLSILPFCSRLTFRRLLHSSHGTSRSRTSSSDTLRSARKPAHAESRFRRQTAAPTRTSRRGRQTRSRTRDDEPVPQGRWSGSSRWLGRSTSAAGLPGDYPVGLLRG